MFGPLTDFHLVLDLDLTLVCSSAELKQLEEMKLYSTPKHSRLRSRVYTLDLVDVMDVPGTGSLTTMWGVFRPYVFQFLNFASRYFAGVHIWSAGKYKYVHAIKDLLFSDPRYTGERYPDTVLTYDDCEHDASGTTKPLVKFFSLESSRAMGANERNTFILDDNELTAVGNPGNLVHIPTYEPSPDIGGLKVSDHRLRQFMSWLTLPDVRGAEDVRALDKRAIFTIPMAGYQRYIRQLLDHQRYLPQ